MLCGWTLPTNPHREARVGAGVRSATALRRALPADLAERVRVHGKIFAGKVSGARLNDTWGKVDNALLLAI